MNDDEYYTLTYSIDVRKEYLKNQFSEDEKELLRPIAETLAILDGNAFFNLPLNNGKAWYEQYLPEADYLFHYCGGKHPDASWMKERNHPNPSVREAWENYQIIKKLAKDNE